MQQIDLLVLILYFLLMLLIGYFASKKLKSSEDFFLPRKFGKAMMTMHAFGSGTASDQAVAVSSATFSKGFSGIWYMWLWLFVTPFYWLLAPLLRRLRCTTIADAYKIRFGHSASVIFAIVGILLLVVKAAIMFKGGGAIISSISSNSISSTQAIFMMAVLMLFYGISGGLSAAIYTDFIQGILSLCFSFMLLPATLSLVGGIDGIRESITEPSFLSILVPGEINIFYILMFTLMGLIGIVAQPHTMSGCGAGRTEGEGRFGYVAGNLLKRICTCAWAVMGVAAFAWFQKEELPILKETPDQIYGILAKKLLSPGFLGLFLAALLASIMSSCDTFMISASALINKNILPSNNEKNSLFKARLCGVCFLAAAVLFSFYFTDILSGLKTWLKIGPILGISFWLGVFWKGYNRAGLICATLAGFLTWFVTHSLKLSDSWQIFYYLLAALLCGVFASLIWKESDTKEKAEAFHKLIATPIQESEVKSGIALSHHEISSKNLEHSFINTQNFFLVRCSLKSISIFLLLFLFAFGLIDVFRHFIGDL